MLSYADLSFCNGYWFNKKLSGEDFSEIITNLTTGYDKRVRPNYGGIPVTVGVSLYLLSISELSEKNMDFTFDMYFRQYWHDPRLKLGTVEQSTYRALQETYHGNQLLYRSQVESVEHKHLEL